MTTANDILKKIKDEGIKYVDLRFTDPRGKLQHVTFDQTMIDEDIFEEGTMFDGSSIEGFVRIEESDMYLKPDLGTFRVLPWPDASGARVGAITCDIANPDGTPFAGCPRTALKRAIARAAALDFRMVASLEAEFFLFQRRDGSPTTLTHDTAGYFDLAPVDQGEDVRREIVLALEQMGFLVEAAHHEVAPGQHEVDFRDDDVLATADNVSTFRFVVKNVALRNGLHATFMPKPIYGINGSGMHTHMSLFEGDTNAFHETGNPFGLSKVAQGFIAGLLHHAPALTAITNQLVNSYKRLIAGYEAPTYITWARNNRSALVRVPVTKHGKQSSTRIEYRATDPACNPYLAFSVILAAGLAGIEGDYHLEEEADSNIFELSEEERRAKGIRLLPSSLADALDQMETSELVRDALGAHIHEWFLRNKRAEWMDYKSQVTQFELERYLPNI